jgi:hypothetical protein
LQQLKYVSGTGSQAVELDGDLTYVGIGGDLRSRQFSYSLESHNISGLTRNAREAKVTMTSLDKKEFDSARKIFDRDLLNGTPGALWFCDQLGKGQWFQRCYVTNSSVSSLTSHMREDSLTLVLLDGAWLHEDKLTLRPQAFTTGLDYPFDYDYDFTGTSMRSVVSNDSVTSANFRMVIFGPAVNPAITIGGNAYQLNFSLTANSYAVIDSQLKMIQIVQADGSIINGFSYGVRGKGQGTGTYIFEKIPSGVSLVQWDNSFGFDLSVFEEESELPWSLS